jgi:cellulose biosynthesis protein BcsQ
MNNDQAQKLRMRVNKLKLDSVIDDIKKVKNFNELYKNLLEQNKTKCKIKTFVNAKGGTGQTTIIYMLTQLFINREKKVAVIDFNKYFSDIKIFFQEPIFTKLDTNNLIKESCLINSKPDINVPTIFQVNRNIKNSEFQIFKSILYQAKLSSYDYIFIDTNFCSNEFLKNIIELTDDFYCISTLDYNSMNNISEFLKELDNIIEKDIYINFIFNKIDTNYKFDKFYSQFDKSKHIKFNADLYLKYDYMLNDFSKLANKDFNVIQESEVVKKINQKIEGFY